MDEPERQAAALDTLRRAFGDKGGIAEDLDDYTI
jgi:hypothetical protein